MSRRRTTPRSGDGRGSFSRGERSPDVHFFTISSGLYFPGFVGLFNSLRLAGHHEPVTVLEREMSPQKKKLLLSHCGVVSLDYEVTNPCHLTAYPSQLDVDGIVVLIDSDALVLDRLDEILQRAREGAICLSPDPDESRYFAEWSDIFDLRAPLRRQTYYNTGFVVFSTHDWPQLLDRWWKALKKVWDRPSFMEGASLKNEPASQPDQDAFNALLMSEVPPDAVHEIPAPWNVFPTDLSSVSVADHDTLSCRQAGETVKVIQSSGSPKPWSWGRLRTREKAYCYLPLLRRVLTGDDAPIRVPATMLPPWLRRGRLGKWCYRVFEKWLNIRILPAGVRQRFSFGSE